MFRLVVVSALLAVAVAAPSASWGHGGLATSYSSVHAPVVAYESHPVTTIQKQVIPGRTLVEVQPRVAVIEQPIVTKVGDQVHSVPTGVSHQSSSVVHSKNVVTPILAHSVQRKVVEAEPEYRTYQEPSIVKTIATQQHVAQTYAHAAPVSWARVASAPVVTKTIAAPVAWSSGNDWSGHGWAGNQWDNGAWAVNSPVVKSAWGQSAVVASPWTHGLEARTVVASPWSSYGYGSKAGHWTGAHDW